MAGRSRRIGVSSVLLMAAAAPSLSARQTAQAPAALVEVPAGARRWSLASMMLGAAAVEAQHAASAGHVDVFKAMDKDGNGIIDRKEYMLGTRDLLDTSGIQEKAFRVLVYDFVLDVYDASDMDLDGSLNEVEVEFGQMLMVEANRVGMDSVELTLNAARRIHKGADVNFDGAVSWQEYVAMVRESFAEWGFDQDEVDEHALHAGMQDIFARADVNDDERLAWRELTFAGFLVTEFMVGQTVSLMQKELDTNGDGRIELKELEELRRQPRVSRHLASGRLFEDFATYDVDSDGSLDSSETALLVARTLDSNRLGH